MGGLCVWSVCGLAHAGPECTRPYTLGLHVHGSLYSARTDAGIDKDVVDAMAARSGCTILTTVMPRARIWRQLEAGTMDFTLSGIATAERDKYASFAWYFSNKYYLLVRKDAGVKDMAGFKAKPDLQLGLIRGFRYGPLTNAWVDQLTAGGRISYATELEPLFGVLALGRIHGMIIEPFDTLEVQSQAIAAVADIIETGDPAVLHGLSMSKKSLSPQEQEHWRALIDSLRQDGTILRIFEKYFPPELARKMVNF
ncbi:substrate-binding periplasmic protein [Variovorax sp. HJSM1_2]|uniref:substrate-binding periplasmic protein n=1 Tax=Variovorax sp. HJSM1_2 TaxID=3366263 RepID=UPI003BEC5F12